MKNSFAGKLCLFFVVVLALAISATAQVDIARKTTAITYPLDDTVTVQFRGTTRFPRMKGSAKVKRSARSGTRVELSVDNMPRPFELGAGYATYVLWAISPTGQADNLGEIKRSGLFFINSKMTVTTPLQTFALIITAEPHFLVTRPSQTIMLENLYPVNANGKQIGTTPSITYFGNISDYFRDPRTPEIAETDYAKTPSAILQAKQAIALARFAGADRDATAELNEAVSLLQSAESSHDAGRDPDTVDIAARKSISASVKAEALAIQRKEAREQRNERTRTDAEIRAAENRYSNAQEQIDNLNAELAREIRNRELAERDALNYSTQLREMREENGRLREDLVKVRLEAENSASRLAAIEAEREKQAKEAQVKESEATLISSLKAFGSVAKNERGIVLTLPENIWNGPRSTDLMPAADGKLSSLAELLAANPDYRITVEAHIDSSGNPEVVQTVTDRRSYILADKFSTLGVAEGRIVAKGFGASVPIAPNTTNANRAKNRRLQIVLSPNL